MIRRAAFAALAAGPLLVLAACGGSNPDRLPDDLAGAEGTPQSQGYNADAVDPEPEPAPPPAPIANDFASRDLDEPEAAEEPVEDASLSRQAADFAPSFPCSNGLAQAERWICGDRALATLDRQLAAAYARALGDADPQQAEALRSTGRRFVDYRNSCPEPACVAQAYQGRLREIGSIMAGPRR